MSIVVRPLLAVGVAEIACEHSRSFAVRREDSGERVGGGCSFIPAGVSVIVCGR